MREIGDMTKDGAKNKYPFMRFIDSKKAWLVYDEDVDGNELVRAPTDMERYMAVLIETPLREKQRDICITCGDKYRDEITSLSRARMKVCDLFKREQAKVEKLQRFMESKGLATEKEGEGDGNS